MLLGSIASPKYVDILTGIFGSRLQFPIAFVGRGDMSRGGLLLRHASDGVELEYVPVLGAVAPWRPAREAAAPGSATAFALRADVACKARNAAEGADVARWL